MSKYVAVASRASVCCVLAVTCALIGASVVIVPSRATSAGAAVAMKRNGHVGQEVVQPRVLRNAPNLHVMAHQMQALGSLGLERPHGHTMRALGGAAPSPHALKIDPLAASSNWSGVIDVGAPPTAFDTVQGSWVVPSVPASSSDQSSATWLGIDGVGASSLIQTGTIQSTGPDYGGVQYDAVVDLLPGNAEAIGDSSGPAPVQPGDLMTASIDETSSTSWTIAISDPDEDWSFSQAFTYSTPGLTAEWIEEDPTVNDSLAALADYGSTTFSNLGIGGSAASFAETIPIYLTSESGAILSYPTDPGGATDSFTCSYGSPAPEVTSVSPDTGSAAGGTLVTIGGDFVTGVTSVAFDGVSVPYSSDLFDWTVDVSVPAHAVGSVDITVTTAGGTSTINADDQFTYQDVPITPIPPQQPITPPDQPTTAAGSVTRGYWLVGSDGGIFSFGAAQFYGSTGSLRLQRPVVGIVPTNDRGGYWLDASDGGVFSFGDTRFFGSLPGLGLHPAGSGLPRSLNAPIVGMVPSNDDAGYFMVAADGGVFAFGDAHFAGSCPGIGGCSGAAVAVIPDASGDGYWLVTKTGNVYTFGDAPFFGAPGQGLVTSAVATPDGKGYWVLLNGGQVFAYGDAVNYGAPPSANFNALDFAATIFPTLDGGGYWVSSAQGQVFRYGDAPDEGGMAGCHLNGSIIAATGF
jgi:Peptidase A4 family/IPT/TIG domain